MSLISLTFTEIQDGDKWANPENRPSYEHIWRKDEETGHQARWPGEESLSLTVKTVHLF